MLFIKNTESTQLNSKLNTLMFLRVDHFLALIIQINEVKTKNKARLIQ